MTNLFTIRLAHSVSKGRVACFSHETIHSEKYGTQRSGTHIVTADTHEEARAELEERIRYDWDSVGRAVPPFVECGKVSWARGYNHLY